MEIKKLSLYHHPYFLQKTAAQKLIRLLFHITQLLLAFDPAAVKS